MKVDAHQHFWRLDRGDYGWLSPALEPIYRDFLPEHLAPAIARAAPVSAAASGRSTLLRLAALSSVTVATAPSMLR